MFRQFYSYVLSKINTYFRKKPIYTTEKQFFKTLKNKKTWIWKPLWSWFDLFIYYLRCDKNSHPSSTNCVLKASWPWVPTVSDGSPAFERDRFRLILYMWSIFHRHSPSASKISQAHAFQQHFAGDDSVQKGLLLKSNIKLFLLNLLKMI